MQRIGYGKLLVMIVCVSLLLVTFMEIHEARAPGDATIFIDPGLIRVYPGNNFTITINVTNVDSLGAWQVVLKYNQTVMNVTAMWVPTENVFGDPAVYPQQSVVPIYGVDYLDHQGYVGFGNSRFSGEVSVSSGVLCMANCTALGEGGTTLLIATRGTPVFVSPNQADAFASFLGTWSDQYQAYVDIPQPLRAKSAVMTSGGGATKPIAAFTATPTLPERAGHLILDGHRPIGDTMFSQAYKTYPVTFNASSSLGMLTLENGTKELSNAGISEYQWDFGDGSNATTDNPIITHTFGNTGNWHVTLWVEDKETPRAKSDTVEMIMVVGLVLDVFNWMPFIYAVFALIVAAVVFYVYRETRRYLRVRRELRARRLSSKRLSQPSQ